MSVFVPFNRKELAVAPKKVLVSGAGVAGEVLAFWLKQHGFSVLVVECATTHRTGGYDVDFRGPALEILDRMGLIDEVRHRQTPRRETLVLDPEGEPELTVPPEVFGGDIEIRKGDLIDILAAATREIPHWFDDTVTALAAQTDGVYVEFRQGESQVFDLVVGADGVHSTVRSLAFGPEREFAHYLGMMGAGFTAPTIFPPADRGFLYRLGGRAAGVSCRADRQDMQVVFSFATDSPLDDRSDAVRQKVVLVEQLGDMKWEVPRLLDAMGKVRELYFDPMSQIRMPSWSTDRVVLVGDAAACAAPTSGLGTSQAVVAAYVLAGELARNAEHAAAFSEYERQLRPYVIENQEIGKRGAEWFLKPEAGQQLEVDPIKMKLKDY
ncbi:FAD-dependent monooxygenase [Kribbella kalugense]|uniref:2-polyprenyl-6-methoxyphenol hydroxylase-like FAD-dependent oxidoreductase n=1 Tax=Kribbella kalugense TaxID=2512221 RepID=A0A4R8A7I2_9ACTN|nr:FAD-dependent monooxygenase [Kribbella kalugense]TDW24290.1 2-polyprenyl-6-methoxyphenol hydroxylase-like FAD-dependent oxidoreductase [Kribbella kalugense]